MAPQLAGWAFELGRAAIWFGLLSAVFIPLERLSAQRRQPILRRQFAVDFAYYLLNSMVTVALLSTLMAAFTLAAQRLLPSGLLAFTGSLPLWARILATLVVGEFGFYWGHRWSHEIPLLWRFHAVHHSAEQIDWLTSSRAHPIDLLFTRLCGYTLVSGVGLAQPGTLSGSVAVSLLTVVTIFWGFFIHANLKWRFGWLESVIATPAFHRWHHTNDRFRNHNYASTLPLYDRLFGTWHLPRQGVPPVFGIDADMPPSLLGQLFSRLDTERAG